MRDRRRIHKWYSVIYFDVNIKPDIHDFLSLVVSDDIQKKKIHVNNSVHVYTRNDM